MRKSRKKKKKAELPDYAAVLKRIKLPPFVAGDPLSGGRRLQELFAGIKRVSRSMRANEKAKEE